MKIIYYFCNQILTITQLAHVNLLEVECNDWRLIQETEQPKRYLVAYCIFNVVGCNDTAFCLFQQAKLNKNCLFY